MFRRLGMVLSLAFLLFISVPTSAENEAYGVTRSSKQGDMVLLMASPDTNGDIIGKYYDGVYVEELDRVGQWSYVKLFSWAEEFSFGYILTEELEPVLDDRILCYPFGKISTEAGEKVSLYAKPQDSATIIGVCPDGTPIGVLGIVGDWYHVVVGKSCQGYVFAQTVDIDLDTIYNEYIMNADLSTVRTKFERNTAGVKDGFISMFALPDVNSDVQYSLTSDIALEVYCDLGEMSQVRLYTFDGFVKNMYLDQANSNP